MRGQGALEYLITYGWAILIIVLIGGGLYALGIFNPSSFVGTKRATGFSSFQIKDWAMIANPPLSQNSMRIAFQNKAGTDVMITALAAVNTTTLSCNVVAGGWVVPADGTAIIPGQVMWCNSFMKTGTPYSLTLTINYTTIDTGLNHTDFGTIAGKIE